MWLEVSQSNADIKLFKRCISHGLLFICAGEPFVTEVELQEKDQEDTPDTGFF